MSRINFSTGVFIGFTLSVIAVCVLNMSRGRGGCLALKWSTVMLERVKSWLLRVRNR